MLKKNSFREELSLKRLRALAFCFGLSFVVLSPAADSAASIELTIFGPKRYDRLKGKPTVYHDTFKRCSPSSTTAVLKIRNGDAKATRLKAATVSINGSELAGESEFKQQVPTIEKTISVQETNTLDVVLKSGMQDDPNNTNSKDQSFLVIELVGKDCDSAPPVISGPEPLDGAILNTAAPRISASYADETNGSGIDASSVRLTVDGNNVTASSSVSSSGVSYTPASPLAEGSHSVTLSVSDFARNAANFTWRFTTDSVSPAIQVTQPQANAAINTPSLAVTGSVIDANPSGLWINGTPVALSGGTFNHTVNLAEGPNTITLRAADLAGNEATVAVPVTLDTVPPVVTISAPAPGALLNTPQVAVTGSVNEAVTGVLVNNIPAAVTGSTFTINLNLSEGQNAITASAKDLAGNTGTASVTVTLDTLAPAPPVLTQPASPTKIAQTTLAGTAESNSTVRVFAAAPNAASQQLGTVIADAQGVFTLPNIALAEGTTTFTATSSDAAGNTSALSTPVSVTLDTAPPVITVTAPVSGTFTNVVQSSIAGTVNEPVTSVTVNGLSAVVSGLTFSLNLSLAEGLNGILLTATDLAGNTSSVTVLVTLDQAPPTITITSPVSGALVNASQTTVTGTVDEPVASVTINGIPAAVSSSTFTLGLNLPEGANTLTVQAIDRAGNIGTKSVSLTVDTQAPAVTITAPSQAAAGAMLSISVTAQDATTGISLAEATANGVPLWSSTPNSELSTQNSIVYTLSPDLAPGTVITLQARAKDLAGNTGAAATQLTVSQGPSGPGYIQGEAYDASRGLRLEAAGVIISSLASTLPPLTTGEDGGYFTEARKGDYLVTIARPGFTTIERLVTVKAEKKSVALDARLTPVNATQNLIDANGGTVSSLLSASSATSAVKIELAVPAGALTSQTDIRVTPISNQGLMNLLPAGWSPIGVVDITTAGSGVTGQGSRVNFIEPATLKVPALSILELAPTSPVTVASYDATTHQWIARSVGKVSADGAFITASISSTGQYAFVLPDTGFVANAVLDLPLPVDPGTLTHDPASVSASGRVVPPAAPPAKGLMAKGELVLAPSASSALEDLPSGLVINAKVTERFDLLSGDSVLPADYVQDLVLYQYPCITNIGSGIISFPTGSGNTSNSEPPTGSFEGRLGTPNSGKVGTTFPVTPSREYTIVDLLIGKVSLSVTLPEPDAGGSLVGTDGGRLLDVDGTVLAIPAGALARTVPVQTKTIAPAVVSGLVGRDFTLLRTVDVSVIGSVLSTTAELSIPVPAGFNPNLPVVIAKAIDVRGATKLRLVALAKLSGSLITSLATGPLPLAPGITSSGMYFFLQAKSQIGFVTGLVTDASNNPFASALVTSDTCSLADLTGAGGKYLIASTVSNFTASAMDIYKYDAGSGTGTITAANQTATVNLKVVMVPPKVVSTNPMNGEIKVEPSSSVVITFSKPLDKTTITTANIVLADNTGAALPGVFSVNPDGTVVTFYPASLMKSETQHTLSISKNIKDLQGYVLGQDATSVFTIKDTTPPPMPQAGMITASFPDADGYVTITATQGSAEYTGTVLIINDNTGEIVAVKPASNGSFFGKISAQLGDEIKIVSMDAAGNQTLISYVAMKSADGKYLVTAKGGIVEGEGGLRLEVPEGALPGPTVVKITPIAESQLPQDNPIPQPGNYLAAVRIDTGGVNFTKEVHLSIPVPSGFNPATPVFVTRPEALLNADGTTEKVYVVVDSTKVVDGRITTASPPFDGIWTFGDFAFLEFPTIYPAIVSGYTYRDMNDNTTYDPGVDLPVKKAVVRSPGGWNYVTYSNDSGFYATFTDVTNDISTNNPANCRDYKVTAIHPQTMNRVTLTGSVCVPPYNIQRLNFKLADANSVPKDTAAPIINMNMQVVPGQTIPGTTIAPQFVAGTIPVGADIDVPISVIDQAINTVTITVNYKTPDMPSGLAYSVQAAQADSVLYATISADNPAPLYKYTYTADFGSTTPSNGYGLPIAGSTATRFKPSAAGTYTITVEATDTSGNKSTRSMTVRAVNPGDQPAGVDGPPRVDELVPGGGAKEIMVTMPVIVAFSEAVDPATVNSDTFQLLDVCPVGVQCLGTGAPVPAAIYTSIEGGRMRATLVPKTNLEYGNVYKIVITNGIKDYAASNTGGSALGIENPSVTTFTTKVPQTYDLSSQDQFQSVSLEDIALYTAASGRTLAYVTAGANGWRIVEVTDPTRPVVVFSRNMSNPGVSWTYRYVAVDQQTGMLAMTENIVYADGNQYGYVRFYELNANPANPTWIGQERLAEAWSGIPGRVALSGNYAYVLTVMAGLQVVDLDLAKITGDDYGASIVGGFDTVGRGFKQPVDIAVYKGGRAVLTTTSGVLLVLDVNIPQYPQLITAYPGQPPLPSGSYTAWHADVAAEYAYTDEAGNSQVMDVAVTYGLNGKIYTLDLTDPYNIHHYGPVKNADGTDLIIVASDIKISKTSGLVYLSAGNGVYVIDIKNPKDPKFLNFIMQTPSSPGSTTTSPLGNSTALVEKDGWVYLANQQKGLRVLDLDPVWLEQYRDDEAFPDSYYPALGEKTITLRGRGPELFDQPLNITNNHGIAPKAKLVSYTPSQGVSVRSKVAGDDNRATFNDAGLATFYIQTGPAFEGGDIIVNFEIDLTTIYGGGTQLQNQNANSYRTSVRLRIRNNSNVTVQDVKTGQAIFVADGIVSLSTGATPTVQRFDFVKEMLNQVVSRKRNLVFNTANAAAPNVTPLPNGHDMYETDQTRYPYHPDNVQAFLVEQGGVFEKTDATTKSLTSQALEIFRRNFRTGNTFYNGALDNDASPTMQKIIRNYGSGLTNGQKTKLLYQIVEKETLVGNNELPSTPVATVTTDNADVLINGTTGNTRNDTGLYELYKNAVERFNRSLINLAESYERNANPNNAITDTQNATDAIGQWVSRTGQAQVKTNATTTLGVSYSYGGRQTIQAFNTNVSRHGAPRSADIASTYSAYAGNIADVSANSLTQFPYGNVGGGNKKWPGLYRDEWNLWAPSQAQYPFYAPWQWAGIDCIGLTIHGLRYADRPASYAVDQIVNNGIDAAIPGVGVAEVCVQNLNATECAIADIHANTGINPLNYTNEEKFFWNPDGKLMFYMGASDYYTQLIHMGDVVEYGAAHISMVHSDAPLCTTTGAGTPNEQTTCTYEIIHASGDGKLCYSQEGQPDNCSFNRKVIVNLINENLKSDTLKNPSGFGRIKLWD